MTAALLIAAAVVIRLGQWLPIVAVVGGVLIPVITEIITKREAPGLLRLVVLTALSAVAGAIASIVGESGTFPLVPTLIAMLISWITAFAAQAGLNESGLLPKLRDKTAGVGVG